MRLKFIAALAALVVAAPALGATRTLETTVDATSVEVLNLIGDARLSRGDGPLRIVATVTADDPAHAAAVRLVTEDDGNRTRVVVEYPEDVDKIRAELPGYARLKAKVRYLDRDVRLDNRSGDRIRADLEIIVPEDTRFSLSQQAGSISGQQLAGELRFKSRFGDVRIADSRGRIYVDTHSGRAEVAGFRGDVIADTGSGPAIVENVLGNVRADTGSGRIGIRGVDGDVEADAGSGAVRIVDVRAEEIRADTGSGSVRMENVTGSLVVDTGSGGVRAEGVIAGRRIEVDTGSGGVDISGDLGAVERVDIDTGSGSVELASTTPLSLRLDLDAGSGGVDVDIPDLSDVRSGRGSFKAVAGTGKGYAKIDTGSGGIRVTAP